MEQIQRIIPDDKELGAFLATKPSALDVLLACGAHYEVIINTGIGGPVTPRVRFPNKNPQPNAPDYYVGNEYDHFRRVEERPIALHYLADCLAEEVKRRSLRVDTFVTVPRGGIAIGNLLADKLKVKSASQVICAHQDGSNLLKRWARKAGAVLVVDDVYHRFSAMRTILEKLKSLGVSEITVACVINRSIHPTVDGFLTASLYYHSTWQYRPEDARSVPAEDPVACWDELLAAMYAAHEKMSQQQASGQLVQQF